MEFRLNLQVNECTFEYINEELQKDKSFIFRIIQVNEKIMKYLNADLQNDVEIIIEYLGAKKMFNIEKERLYTLIILYFLFNK